LELKQLERFLAVYDEGSLALAAKTLGLTQQALSASLANLEEQAGTRLFDRAPGGVTKPTAAGSALVAHARAQLAADKRAVQDIQSIVNGLTGTVTIGVGEAFAGNIIVEAVSALREKSPQVRVNLIEGYSEQLRYRLYDGEFDFIAAGVSAFEVNSEFEREQIYSCDDVIVCRADHPLANRKKLKLADLCGYGWLVPYSRPEDLNTIVDTFVAQNLEPPANVIGSDAYRIGMQLLAGSDLLVMVSPVLIAPELSTAMPLLTRLNISKPTIRRHASLIYPKARPMTGPAQLLLEEVRKKARAFSKQLS